MLESHRRTLKIESAAAKSATYLQNAYASPNLNRLARQQIADIHCIIQGGCGLFGSGKLFWETAPAVCLKPILNSTSPFANKIAELRALRARLPPYFTVATELDWGFYLIAALNHLQSDLLDVRDNAKAKSALDSLKALMERRELVYLENLKPILLYGAKLSAFHSDLFKLCQGLRGIIDRPFPADCKLATISARGQLLDGLNQSLALGHLGLRQQPVIPFDANCLAVKPLAPETIKAMTESFLTFENSLITKLLTDAGYDTEPKPVILMRRGREEVLARMQNDAHNTNLTDVLWPSASLQEAAYNPSIIFGMPP